MDILDCRTDYGVDVDARRLAEHLFRKYEGHKWRSMDNIFIDSMQSFPELLTHILYKPNEEGDKCFYWLYDDMGRTRNYLYFPYEDCVKISWDETGTKIQMEAIRYKP